MSDNKKNEPQKTTTAGGAQGPNPIPVKVARFLTPQDIPRKAATSSVATAVQDNRDQYEVLYLPWMRHFQITCRPVGDQPIETIMVHETHVKNWTPLEP